jgi:two-component system phosphate regulon response regulator PhoB
MMRILIIEDEPDIRKTIEYNFVKEGFKVSVAGSLAEGKKLFLAETINLIILDLMLPDGSGLDLCREIKSNPSSSSTPIIILTAKTDEVDRVVGFELGADDYVTKPFSVRELLLRVKAILKRAPSSTSKTIGEQIVGNLKIDFDAHIVLVKGEEIKLTALEFKLLKHFLDRRGRVQSRDQLLQDVWGYSSDITTRTVDTHIKRLREKLCSAGDYIQTIRGVGYKFNSGA